MRVISCIATEHNLWLVLLAAAICVSGTWVAFDLIQRARVRGGLQKAGWIFLSAVACGSSIWCAHFIGMLAYEVKTSVAFDPLMTFASLLVVIAGCWLAISIALSRPHDAFPLLGGIVAGLTIAAMHYTGMMAYHVEGLVTWNAGYIAASVALSLPFSVAAFDLLIQGPWKHSKPISTGLFAAGVVLLHFTGMTGISVIPLSPEATGNANELAGMAIAIAGGSLVILATGIATYLIDTHANQESVQQLQRLALNDSLTGLPNRFNFNNQLAQSISRVEASDRKLAVIGIDLDRFKEINDLRGHEAGDQALRIIAQRLKDLLQDGEFAARIGGDEFAATKCYREHSELLDFVARLENALFCPIQIEDFETVTGASIGVSIYPQDGDTQERLTCNADLAMYRAKADVGRAVCFYEPTMDETSRERRNLAQDLRQAIECDQLELYYQVQATVATGSVCGYEVLLRWKHPQRGMVPPVEFIPLAEETGSILAIGDWVLKTACAQAASWAEPHKIAVNISPVQLGHLNLANRVHEILLETGLAASRLELEITESAIIADKERTLHQLRRIRALGVTVAIDDFGTGYSSLDTLRSFPFDKIKLDRAFMNEIERSAQATAIVRAVLALGKSLNIPVLAEGVETNDQFSILKREGCDEAQGYLLGRPSPILNAPPSALSDDVSGPMAA
ncbi:putative bifunctional diguanylate cyclase/phosphodiesterase [Leptospira interrogans]